MSSMHTGQRKSGPWLLQASAHSDSRWFTAADDDDPSSKNQQPGSSSSPSLPSTGTPTNAAGYGGAASASGFADIAPPPVAQFSPSFSGGGGGAAAGGSAGAASGGGGGPVNYSPSAGVDQWETQVEEGLRRNGLPTTPDYINKVKHQIQTESSGNPKAINNWDSNAQAGHASQGLLQTIPSTFQQYHHQGDSNDITDPQANIDSAIGYAKSRYGPSLMSNGNGMGSGHGY